MPLINCEISLVLTWYKKCVISSAVEITKFEIRDTKLYVHFVTLSTEDNLKLLKQLESGFKRTINLPTEELKDHSVIIDRRSFFDQPIKNGFKTYDNIRKIATGQGDDYTTGCLLDHNCFKGH